MKIGELCSRVVVFAYKNMPLTEAAKLMREHHVGSLIVVREDDSKRTPVGIITDRDIVVEVLAAGLDFRTLTVGEIMTDELITAREQDDTLDVLGLMRKRGIRRVPVVTPSGALAGIATIDDILGVLSEELDGIVRAIDGEQAKEVAKRR
ncbi:MAG: CBS domain-containing protein [Acidobacteriia bacterium]|nr:CBS domain-containing protein [Terriglobia bacterium]